MTTWTHWESSIRRHNDKEFENITSNIQVAKRGVRVKKC